MASRRLAGRIEGEARTDRHPLAYATDGSVYRVVPQAVCSSRAPDDLALALALRARQGVPLTIRGAGTSLAGQAVGAGLVLDAARRDRIL